MLSHRYACVASVTGEILATSKNDEAVGVRMSMPGGQTPIGKLFQQRGCMMSLTGTTLKGECGRVAGPITAPEEHVVVGKVMPGFLLRHAEWLNSRVIPNKRPEVFGINLIEAFEPKSNALCFATTKTLGNAVKQIVVCLKVPIGMCPRIFLSAAGSS